LQVLIAEISLNVCFLIYVYSSICQRLWLNLSLPLPRRYSPLLAVTAWVRFPFIICHLMERA